MKQRNDWIGFVLLCVPVFVYGQYIYKYSVNVPQFDEYRTLADFLHNITNPALSFKSQLQLLFESENESKPIYHRLIALVWYGCAEQLDFRWLVWVGNLGVLGIAGIFYYLFRYLKIKNLYFLPVCLLLFQAQYWVSTFRADASIFYFHSVFWALLSMVLIAQRTPQAFRWALLAGVVCSSANALGLLVFGAGIIILYLQARQRQLLWWVLACVLVYFVFVFAPHAPSTSNRLLDGLLQNPLENIALFFAYIGGVFNHTNFFSAWKIIVLGVLIYGGIVAVLVRIFSNSPYKRHSRMFMALLCMVLFLTLMQVMMVFTHWLGSFENTLYEVVTERSKKLFSVIFVILLYLCVLLASSERWYRLIFACFGGMGLLFSFLTYYYATPEVAFQQKKLMLDSFQWRHSKTLASMPIEPHNPTLIKLYAWFEATKKYTFPKVFYEPYEPTILKKVDSTTVLQPFDLKIGSFKNNVPDMYGQHRRYFSFSNNDYVNPAKGQFDGAYLLLKSTQYTFMIPTVSNPAGKWAYLLSNAPYSPGFKTTPQVAFPKGLYQVGVYCFEYGNHRLLWTKHQVQVE